MATDRWLSSVVLVAVMVGGALAFNQIVACQRFKACVASAKDVTQCGKP